MNRTPLIILALGFALITTGFMFMAMMTPANENIAYANLPDDHPPIPPNAVNGNSPLAPTTKEDFFSPGTQPNTLIDDITEPFSCRQCHEGYSAIVPQPDEYEPWTGWQGSMMAQAGRDPVFYAALDIANADAGGAGEFCLRCHLPRAWVNGRIVDGNIDPTADLNDLARDLEGVQCEICHRMVDPEFTAGNPDRDSSIIAALTSTVYITTGNAAFIFDPEDHRRGPFDLSTDWNIDPHVAGAGAKETLHSPYHQESALCGTCHDISNPAISWNEATGTYELNDTNTPFTDTSKMFPIERTYSEWRLSDFNTPEGIYAPQFGGNKTNVSSCQDCHMRDVTGVGGTFFGSTVTRDDMPLHDLAGANTWVPQIIPQHPVFSATFNNDPSRVDALNQGIARSRYMLQNAASLATQFDEDNHELSVRVYNRSGHKLPTGYVEGRRMWIQVEGYDISGTLVYTSGAYDVASGDLYITPDIQIYESKHGVTGTIATDVLSLPIGAETFHFALNNIILTDNRIPPQGFDYDEFLAVGAEPRWDGQPDPTMYADGQYWDDIVYALPDSVVAGKVRLLYQTSSKEYIEFLRDNNPNSGNPNNNGQILYELWNNGTKSAPETMVEIGFGHDTFLPTIQNP